MTEERSERKDLSYYYNYFEALCDLKNEGKLPESKLWIYDAGREKMVEEFFTENDLLYLIFGNMNYQICNGGCIQWYDNGYAESFFEKVISKYAYEAEEDKPESDHDCREDKRLGQGIGISFRGEARCWQ